VAFYPVLRFLAGFAKTAFKAGCCSLYYNRRW